MDSLFRVPLALWNNILLELPSPPTTKFQNWRAGGRGSRDVRGSKEVPGAWP